MKKSKEHGVIGEHSIRTVGMDPALGRQVVREEEDLRYPLLESSLEPPRVRIAVSNQSIGLLENGLGANWSPPNQGEEAFPEDHDEAGWKSVFDGMNEVGIRWARFWLQPDGVVKEGKVDKNHRFLQRLDRLQAWAENTDSRIMLDLSEVPLEFQSSPAYDAPADNRLYVDEYIIPLLKHVLLERRCSRVRQLCLYNEPFNTDVAPYTFAPPPPKDPLLHYLELHEILRAAMDQAGLKQVALIGPNTANMFQRHVEMFEDKGLGERVTRTFGELDVHAWRFRFDYYPPSKRWPGYGMTEGIERYLRPTLAAARRMGKRLSITEAGSMYFNENPRTDRNTRHDSFLTVSEVILRCLNEGVAGAMIWAFTNSGRIDGQWGLIGTREKGFAKVPNLFNGYTCLMRPQRVGAEIRTCTAARSDFSSFITAAAQVQPGVGETVWLINDHPVEKIAVTLALPADRSRKPWVVTRKGFDSDLKTLPDMPDGDTLELVLPGMSLTALAT